jgi:GNAT superfamily N-acetyltransferase
VRLATDADIEAIARLRREWTIENGDASDEPGFEHRVGAWVEGEGARRLIWLAEIDGAVVGMLNLAVFTRMPRPGQRPSRWGYIANVFVQAPRRSSSVGRALLSAALEHSRAQRFARLVLSPSPRSAPFYLRAGFTPASSLLLLELSADPVTGPMALRELTEADLPLISRWSNEPHVDQWWHEAADLDKTRETYLPNINGTDPTHVLVVELDGRPIGLAQWAWWRDYPAEAARRGAGVDEVGIDYFIGVPELTGRGLGTRLIAELLSQVRSAVPAAGGVLVDPEASNRASTRALEKNGFRLEQVVQIDDPDSYPIGPTALYRKRFIA